jgi:hypothetical protein
VALSGAPNFRQTEGYPIYGVGQVRDEKEMKKRTRKKKEMETKLSLISTIPKKAH